MKRVLLVVGSYPPAQCGVGDYSQRLSASLAAHSDLKVGVLTTELEGRDGAGSIDLVCPMKTWGLFTLPSVVRGICRWNPDLLHFQFPSQGIDNRIMPFILPLLCHLLGFKVIQTWHEPYRWRRLMQFLLLVVGTRGLIFVRPNYLNLIPMVFRWVVKKKPRATIINASSLPVCQRNIDEWTSIRQRFLSGQKRLIVFFGFVYPRKGIEHVFEIANPQTDRVVIAGTVPDQNYAKDLSETAKEKGWDKKVGFTGFLSPQDAADLLSVADAVLLPFLDGGGNWNTSIHGALAQGTLVITTSNEPFGYDVDRNLFTANPLAISEMRDALNTYAGRRVPALDPETRWKEIAVEHVDFYRRQSV